MLNSRQHPLMVTWWWWWCVGGMGVLCMVSEGPFIISTPSGKLRGERYRLHDGSRGVKFLGIPYAKPPLGPRRFAAPESAEPWEGVRDALSFGPMCYQPLENEVWDLVESEIVLDKVEEKQLEAWVKELGGGQLYEEEMEEVEEAVRRKTEEVQRQNKKRNEEEKERRCRGAGRVSEECVEWNLDYVSEEEEEVQVEVLEEEEEQKGEKEVVTQINAVFRTRGPSTGDGGRGGGGDNDSAGGGATVESIIEERSRLPNRQTTVGNETHSSIAARANKRRRGERGREWRRKKKRKKEEALMRKREERRGGRKRRRMRGEEQNKEVKKKNEQERKGKEGEKDYVHRKAKRKKEDDYFKIERRKEVRKRRLVEEGRTAVIEEREKKEEIAGKRSVLYMKEKSMSEYVMSEDCLTLNVYTPLPEGGGGTGGGFGPRRRLANASLPLVLYIHGGSFYSNGGQLYPGEKLASLGLVVVTINYRLGPFGFLSTGDRAAWGNWGLLDQRLALLWARRHARSFGASPSKILLLGNSAGAASVILHLVSPLSSGLFSRAVALSGCALAPWSLQSRPLHFAHQMGGDLGCTQSDTTALVQCLRTVKADRINKVYGEKHVQDGLWLVFAPVVEGEQVGAFLPQPPRSLMEQGRFSRVPLLISLTRDEVTIWFSKRQSDISLDHAEKWIDIIIRQNYPSLEPLAMAAVMHVVRASYLYTKGHEANTNTTTAATTATTTAATTTATTINLNNNNSINSSGSGGSWSSSSSSINSSSGSGNNYNFTPATTTSSTSTTSAATSAASRRSMDLTKVVADLISDLGLRVPCVEEARLLSRWTTIYLAEFSYSSMDDVRVGRQEWIGSYHESELQFVFGLPFLGLVNTLRSPQDRTVAATFMQLLGSFAHSGVPNVSGVNWPSYNQSHQIHLQMSDNLNLGYNLVQPKLCFWKELIPLLTLWPINPPRNDPSSASSLLTPTPSSFLYTFPSLPLSSFLHLILFLFLLLLLPTRLHLDLMDT